MKAATPAEVEDLGALLADCSYSVEEVRFDTEAGEFLLRFELRADQLDLSELPAVEVIDETRFMLTRKIPVVRCTLYVRRVRAMSTDGEVVEPGGVSEVTFDPERGRVTVFSSPGPHWLLDVDVLDVAVDVTDEVDHCVRVRSGLLGEFERPWEE